MITTTISSKNQITVPTFLLKSLNLRSGDKLIMQMENNGLCIKPVGKSLIESLAGSLKIDQDKKGIEFGEVLEKTKKIAAKKLAKK